MSLSRCRMLRYSCHASKGWRSLAVGVAPRGDWWRHIHFQHAPDIWREFPQLAAGLAYVGGVDDRPDVAARLRPDVARLRERQAGGHESQLPEVDAWRRAYAQMGLKPTQYRSAAEALLRRFRQGDELPVLHPLVDLCNAVSLAFALPVAVVDLDRVAGSLEVRHAEGDERYLGFSGEVETPEPGELPHLDAVVGYLLAGAHAFRDITRERRLSPAAPVPAHGLFSTKSGAHCRLGSAIPADAGTRPPSLRPAGRPALPGPGTAAAAAPHQAAERKGPGASRIGLTRATRRSYALRAPLDPAAATGGGLVRARPMPEQPASGATDRAGAAAN